MLHLLVQNFQVSVIQLLQRIIGVKLWSSVLLRHYNERALIHALKFVHHDFNLAVVDIPMLEICNVCPVLE
jgi:hypothetical protein